MGLAAHGDHRVDEDREIGAATQAIDGVLRFRVAGIEVRRGGRGQVSAGREPDDADPARVDVPLLGVETDRANGPLGIQQRHEGPAAGKPVLQHDPCDAVLVEPLGDAMPFRADDQAAVTAARADHYGRSVGLRRRRPMDGDGSVGCLELAIARGGVAGPEGELLRAGRRGLGSDQGPCRGGRDGDRQQENRLKRALGQ